MDETHFMNQAVITCRAGIASGQSPFGAVVVKDGVILSATHNTVRRDNDPTAHAEVNAIRAAAKALGTFDLSGTTLYSTCEPCPMCLAATHWARVDRLVFGASIADAEAAGFREMPVAAATLASMGKSPLIIAGGMLESECKRLFLEWKNAGISPPY